MTDDVRLTVDGTEVALPATAASSLLRALRDGGFTGTKGACEQGECGSCSVLVDDVLVCACLVPALSCAGARVRTVSSLASADLAAAMAEHGAVQCGFCTPGFVVTAASLLSEGIPLDAEKVREGLAGNLCRCTGYEGLVRAIVATSEQRAR